MSKHNGGPAFPHVRTYYAGTVDVEKRDMPGMTLRDYFAAKALTGILSTGELNEVAEGGPETVAEFGARVAFILADAMIEARDK